MSVPHLYYHELICRSRTRYLLSQSPPITLPTNYTFLLLLKHHTIMPNSIPINITELHQNLTRGILRWKLVLTVLWKLNIQIFPQSDYTIEEH